MAKKKIICLGEILWDALPKGIYLGGSPLNVALNLDNLGIDSKIVSAVGKDRLGRLALKSIEQKSLKSELIQLNNYPTSLAEVEIDEKGIPTYEIHENVAWDFIKKTDEITTEINNSDFIVIGTLIFRNSSANTVRELLKDYKGKVVVDVNLRKPFYSEELLDEVLYLSNIVKFNRIELEEFLKWKKIVLDHEEALKWLSEKYDIDTVLLSRGEKGAYIYHEGELCRKGRYYVKVRDTVGAGDAFLAGAIYSLIKGKDAYDTVCFANAMGAFVTSRNGATPTLNMDKINIYLKYGK
ncbi:MAG: carbohydrate kinase [Balneolaceae bacterium]